MLGVQVDLRDHRYVLILIVFSPTHFRRIVFGLGWTPGAGRSGNFVKSQNGLGTVFAS